MTFTSKFNLNQEVWFLKNDIVKSEQIKQITIEAYAGDETPSTLYTFASYGDGSAYLQLDESKVFASKAELLASL